MLLLPSGCCREWLCRGWTCSGDEVVACLVTPRAAFTLDGVSGVELDVLIREWRSRAQRPILVALDGRSGVGKTTLAADVARRHDGAVIVADDFYSGASDADWQRLPAPDRVARVIDWQRLRTEALEPLLDGRTARWRPFDWQAGQDTSNDLLEQQPVPMVVLDGAYSARPELADLIDIAVLLQLDDGTRRSRLIAREGARFMQR